MFKANWSAFYHLRLNMFTYSSLQFERVSVVEDQTVHHVLFATFNAGNHQILLRAI